MMRKGAFFANLVALFVVPAIPAALSAQRIQRAIAEQAVEFFFIDPLVAGELLAFPVLEELMVQVFVHYAFTPFCSVKIYTGLWAVMSR